MHAWNSLARRCRAGLERRAAQLVLLWPARRQEDGSDHPDARRRGHRQRGREVDDHHDAGGHGHDRADRDKATVKADKGETMTFGQSVDDATIKELDLPVYPKAEGQGSMDMGGQRDGHLPDQGAVRRRRELVRDGTRQRLGQVDDVLRRQQVHRLLEQGHGEEGRRHDLGRQGGRHDHPDAGDREEVADRHSGDGPGRRPGTWGASPTVRTPPVPPSARTARR